MTSRTNRQSEGQHQGNSIEGSPYGLEQRPQLAVARYLAGDPIEAICHEMGCSKSWLYKWKNRYQAAEPTWSQERSRRPETSPGKTPAAIEAAIIRLRQTLLPNGSATVSARVIRDHLRQHSVAAVPSLRTICRILQRPTQEGISHAVKWSGAGSRSSSRTPHRQIDEEVQTPGGSRLLVF
jgi:Homeodomain-like domain